MSQSPETEDDTHPSDPNSRSPLMVIVIGVLMVVGIFFLMMGPCSDTSRASRDARKAITSYAFPPTGKRLAELLHSPIADIAVQTECERMRHQSTRNFRESICSVGEVTVTDREGVSYKFQPGGFGFIGDFIPTNDAAKRLLYGEAVPPETPLQNFRPFREWSTEFRKQWEQPGVSLEENLKVETDGYVTEASFLFKTEDGQILAEIMSRFVIETSAVSEKLMEATIGRTPGEWKFRQPAKNLDQIRKEFLASLPLSAPDYFLQSMVFRFFDHAFLTLSGLRLVELGLSLCAPDINWTSVAEEASTAAAQMWDQCQSERKPPNTPCVKHIEFKDVPWWPAMNIEMEGGVVEIGVAGKQLSDPFGQ